MKSPTVFLLLAASSALAQGNFQNLDFESAVVPNVPPDQFVYPISLTNILPGWTGYYNTNQGQFGSYNGVPMSRVNIGLVDGHTSYYSNFVIEGYFTAVLQTGNVNPPLTYGSAGIGQTSLIPGDARSLLFDARMLEGFTSNVLATVNGQVLPFTQVSAGANFIRYGIDISAFAGQTAEIRFTAEPGFGLPDPYTGVLLDNIQFSSSAIPEPSVLTLSALGTLLLTCRFLRQHFKREQSQIR